MTIIYIIYTSNVYCYMELSKHFNIMSNQPRTNKQSEDRLKVA